MEHEALVKAGHDGAAREGRGTTARVSFSSRLQADLRIEGLK
jgi:hypothetical protein